ncbi:MAG: type II toxin-antitoxin system VapC family toxin [Acidobacteria bacterium]|nr:type II toxin-antitoxin system VapC family toxin [Acidobacteriota bacterium]
MKYLLDTCVISELVTPYPNEKVIKWLEERKENDLFLSVLTIGEIHKGIAKLPDSKKKRVLIKWVEDDLKKRFMGRVLEITEAIAIQWGDILGDSEKKGKKMSVIDGLIAASAIEEGLTVVTRNIKDIKNSGARIINPWE